MAYLPSTRTRPNQYRLEHHGSYFASDLPWWCILWGNLSWNCNRRGDRRGLGFSSIFSTLCIHTYIYMYIFVLASVFSFNNYYPVSEYKPFSVYLIHRSRIAGSKYSGPSRGRARQLSPVLYVRDLGFPSIYHCHMGHVRHAT